MKTATFKKTFMSGLIGLAYSGTMIAGVGNVKDEDECIAIEEVPVADGTTACIDEPETNLS